VPDVEAPCRRGCKLVDGAQQELLHGRLLAQLGGDGCRDERARGLDRQCVEHLVEEAGDDEALGARRMQAAALEVEALVFVDRSDGRGVAALDVVVLDLQVGNRLGPRLVGQLDVAVRLERVGASRIGSHVYEPGVDRTRPVVDHAFEQQVARRVARRVILEGAEVE
jgi:hypothetical protein